MLKKYMTIMAISLIAFSSCQDQISIPGGDGETQAPDNEEIIYPIEKTFYSVDGFSKTLLNSTQVLWETGDKINLFWSEGGGGSTSAVAAPFNSNANAEFRTRVAEDAETFYAVHPYSDEASLSDGKVTVKVPTVQDGTFSSACIAAAKADADNHLAFKHMVSFVEFSIDKCGTLTFSCGADITGTVTADFAEDGSMTVAQSGSGEEISVEIPCSGTYYIALLPEVEMDFLSFTLTNGSTTEYILSTKPKTMTRGKLIGLGNITDRFSSKRPLGATTENFEIFDYIF